MGALDASVQGASFYVEKIKLASRLRELYQNGVGVGHFQAKSPLSYLLTPTHQISLFATIDTLNNFFLYKTQKQTNMSLSRRFQLYFTF